MTHGSVISKKTNFKRFIQTIGRMGSVKAAEYHA